MVARVLYLIPGMVNCCDHGAQFGDLWCPLWLFMVSTLGAFNLQVPSEVPQHLPPKLGHLLEASEH
jgi:hypothetical protein